jgi:hypothetical protein
MHVAEKHLDVVGTEALRIKEEGTVAPRKTASGVGRNDDLRLRDFTHHRVRLPIMEMVAVELP